MRVGSHLIVCRQQHGRFVPRTVQLPLSAAVAVLRYRIICILGVRVATATHLKFSGCRIAFFYAALHHAYAKSATHPGFKRSALPAHASAASSTTKLSGAIMPNAATAPALALDPALALALAPAPASRDPPAVHIV